MIPKLALLFPIIISGFTLFAQWNYDSLTNNPVSTGPTRNSSNPAIISDGNGGYYITWMQGVANLYPSDIYAQHINANGTPLWGANGIVICNNPADQFWPVLVSDGSGGVIIAWQDNRTNLDFYIYAQRITSTGTLLWANNGVRITNSFDEELGPDIISDGSGGAIISFWRSQNGGLITDVYAQRINSSGNAVWAAGGMPVCNATGRQEVQKMIPDGTGGAIITWMDFRVTFSIPDIYAQRINSSGAPVWTTNGIAVCASPNDQQYPRITTNGLNGAIITWIDFRNPTTDIYIQNITSSGSALWTANGVPVCTQPNNQFDASIVTDGIGGAVICWYDARNNGQGIYAQRVTSAGVRLWQADGKPVCTVLNKYSPPLMTAIGNSRVIIGWEDKRNNIEQNVYAQQLDANGNDVWTSQGVPVCSAPNYQIFQLTNGQSDHGAIISDGSGGAILAWQDGRHSTFTNVIDDIYISKLENAPVITPVLLNVTNQFQNSPSAKGKLANPPTNIAVSVKLDNVSIPYSAADSSFQYFTTGVTLPGNHLVQVNYYNFAGSTQKDSSFVVNIVTGVGGILSRGQIRVYPNPANERLTIDSLRLSDKWKYVRILTADGREVIKRAINNQQVTTVNVSFLKPGVYFIQIVNTEGISRKDSFIKIR
jgi:hypothetical protein